MNKTKESYISPTSETLVVRFEGCLCASFGKEGTAGNVRSGNVYSFGDDDENE